MVINDATGQLTKRKKHTHTAVKPVITKRKHVSKQNVPISRATGDLRTDMSFQTYTDLHNVQHSVRILTVTNMRTHAIASYVHAADLGGCVERKSNISRLFGQFLSPSEKVLMNVCGSHNHTIGQESNVLTVRGVYRFFKCSKMRDQPHFIQWITDTIVPILLTQTTATRAELMPTDVELNAAPARTVHKRADSAEPEVIYTTTPPMRAVQRSVTQSDSDVESDDSSDETYRGH